MNGSIGWSFFVMTVLIAEPLLLLPGDGVAENDQKKLPPVREIPGLTIEDKFSGGCVDCHINKPNSKQDKRISTLMSQWYANVEAGLLEKARAVSQSGVVLKGKHPPSAKSLNDIPAACITCHRKKNEQAPPLAALVHAVHLTGGENNHYLTLFQGECTYCHKLNQTTGIWTVPSGPEKWESVR